MVFVVDYNDFLRSLSGKCRVRPKSVPESIISYEAEPVAISCVLEDR
jgi:hypothetical protein